MVKARTLFRNVWFGRAVAMILLALFANYLHKVFTEFSMVYVDPDQLLMMYGTQEFLAGRFHMPRFFGQDYGSMLESFVAMPFTGWSLEVALPIATTILLFLPYLLIIRNTGNSHRAISLVFVWLLVLPAEYLFIGTMPRDFLSGLAVTSIALFFINGRSRYQLMLFGFFCIVGWSFNQNAALFGATITIYSILASDQNRFDRFRWITIGYTIGLIGHLGMQAYMAANSQWIVHQSWPLQFRFDLIAKGISNLDSYWGAITPFAYRKSWILAILYFIIIAFGKNKAVRYSAIGLIFLVVLSFGVPKVHDGYLSIFSPYERMFLGIPLSMFFLFIASKWHERIPVLLMLIIGVMFFNVRKNAVAERVLTQVEYGKEHILPYGKMDGVYARTAFLNDLVRQYQVEVVLIGPQAFFADILVQKGSIGLDSNLIIISPGYDRKTWLLREVENRTFDRILWLQNEISKDEIETSTGLKVTDLRLKGKGFKDEGYYFLLEGEKVNPLKVYEDCGFKVCNH
ncbi:MAG: hypothetical protein ACI9YU_000337 [Flavobacteriales bacterium]|jgi:hypothetical protein